MNSKFDLIYYTYGFWSDFTPLTPAGEKAWCEIARQTTQALQTLSLEGDLPVDCKMPTSWLKSVIYQLRKAGYRVRKGTSRDREAGMGDMTDDEILAALKD